MADFTRRAFVAGAAAAGASPMIGVARAQQGYPAGLTVKFVVGFPAGGAQDIVGRIIADRLGALWKVPTVVENIPGAGGNLAMDRVAKGPTDGTQICIVPPGIATNQFLYPRLRLRSGEGHRPARPGRDRAEPAVRAQGPAGQFRGRADRLRQGQSGQAQLRLLGHRHHHPSLGRAVQAHGRRRHGARRLPRQRAGAERSRRPERRSDVRQHHLDHRPGARRRGQAARHHADQAVDAWRRSIAPIAATLPGYETTRPGRASACAPARPRRSATRSRRIRARSARIRCCGNGWRRWSPRRSVQRRRVRWPSSPSERAKWGKLITDIKLKLE